jgi:hypothetical protein
MLHRDDSEQGVYQASRNCGHCAQCGRGLDSAEPVWRDVFQFYKTRLGQGGMSFTVAPVCKKCHLEDYDWAPARPCERCQRLVVNLPRFNRKHTFCCKSCEILYYSHRRKKAAAQQVCVQCDGVFRPTRSDSLYCSNACRQRSYRKRAKEFASPD